MEKKKALVTGAGTGIGQGIAAALGKAGYDVVVHYNASAAGAQETVRMVQAAGARAWAVQADLTKKEEIDRLFETALAHLGGLDLYVNNSGVTQKSVFEQTPESQLDFMYQIDFKAAYFCVQAAAKVMIARKTAGNIVIITSNAEKELPDAFLRRCVFHYIEFPEQEQIRELERVILLKVIDRKWMDHIDDMEQLRQGIGLQAYGQKDPLVEYKMNAYEMFDDMTAAIREDTIRILCHIRVEEKVEREPAAKVTGTNRDDSAARAPQRRQTQKIYPNDPCPCGSGKKYKQCCGRKPLA